MKRNKLYFGNAEKDGTASRFWIMGSFMDNFLKDKNDPRIAKDLEIKWGVHKKGEGKDAWTQLRTAKTLTILVRGKFQVRTKDKNFLLAKEGDYLIFGPGVPHTWLALEDTVIMTIRWPSVPDDVEVVEI